MTYHNYPILKVLIPYLLGIFLAYFGDFLQLKNYLSLITILIFLLFSYYLSKKKSIKAHCFSGGLLQIATLCVGFFITNSQFASPFSQEELNLILENKLWTARLLDEPIEKKKSVKITVSFEGDVKQNRVKQKAVLYIQKDSNALQLAYGDMILINTSLSLVEKNKNPEAFNQQLFLRRKGVYFTGYVPSVAWHALGSRSVNPIKKGSQYLQNIFSSQFADCGIEGKEYDIITAILLGADETMDSELKSQYASAGVSHILSVSGMHVGLMFMLVNFLLKPLDISRKTKWVKIVIIIIFVWFYAAVTGLSPSVQRAAVMFSFASVGTILKRNTNIYHSLFASLFILLLIKPMLLFEIGFQLSYLAVFGIVLFQKKICNIFKIKNKIGLYFWELASVSIAAQIATFPISIYYFGQFPNYFLISNLSIIFLSFVIMITGIITLVVSFFPFIVKWISLILIYEIKTMNFIVMTVEQLPGAVTDGIYYSFFQTFMLYLFILFLYLFFQKRRGLHLILGLTVFFFFAADFSVRQFVNQQRNEITLYSTPKMLAMNFNDGGRAYLLSDSIKNKNAMQYNFSIKNHERKNKIKSQIIGLDTAFVKNRHLMKHNNFIFFSDRKVYILSRQQKLHPTGSPMKLDYLIIHDNPKISPEIVFKVFDTHLVIIDETNSFYSKKKWKSYCQQAKIDYYSISEKGSLSL